MIRKDSVLLRSQIWIPEWSWEAWIWIRTKQVMIHKTNKRAWDTPSVVNIHQWPGKVHVCIHIFMRASITDMIMGVDVSNYPFSQRLIRAGNNRLIQSLTVRGCTLQLAPLRFNFLFFRDYFRGNHSNSLWHHTGCALMYRGRSVFPNCFCSMKGPPGYPGWESNPRPTEWQAGGLTIELCLTPITILGL